MKKSIALVVVLSSLAVGVMLAAVRPLKVAANPPAVTVKPTPLPGPVGTLPNAAYDKLPDGPILRLRVGTFDPVRNKPPVPPGLARRLEPSEAALRLVQFSGPIDDGWYDEMARAGVGIVTYIPDYAYLIWGTAGDVANLTRRSPVRWSGDYEGHYALHPRLQHARSMAEDVRPTSLRVAVQLYYHEDIEASLAAVSERARRVVRAPLTVRGLTTIGVEVNSTDLAWLAVRPDVVSVEPLLAPRLLDEIQGQILAGHLTPEGTMPSGQGYLEWLTATVGFTTTPSAYPIVDITDDGIDNGGDVPMHSDFYEAGDPARTDRLAYNANWTSDPSADGGGGHGTINAAIVGGYNALTGFPYEDTDGYNYGLGINPLGRVAGSKIFGNTSGWAYPDYVDLVSHAYASGARIISNSWGDEALAGEYTIDDQTYDSLVRDADPTEPGNQSVTVVFAAGNSGYQGAGSVGSPANAKNVITVGASESYRPSWTDGCFIGPSDADNASDIASFSSQGPTDDGRLKPELVAPGTHIQGAASQTADYTGDYVCDAYYPSGQKLYAASSGTSHATPAVAGAASLLHRFYQDHLSSSAPSPAMVKAYLVNAARYLDGIGAGDTLPSVRQGYGAVNLGMSFDAAPRIVQDQDVLFRETGATYVIQGHVAQPEKPLRVTLAWTDAPGPTVGAAYVNDLDLSVEIAGSLYHGNVFSGSLSVPGGTPDPRNNVESVFLPTGIQGDFVITVTAANVAGDGVPHNDDVTDQDFALVCYNCSLEPSFDLAILPSTQAICQSSSAAYTVTTTAIGDFTGGISLEATAYPEGLAVDLTPQTVAAGEASQLTMSETSLIPSGSYTVEVTAISGEHRKVEEAELVINSAPPSTAKAMLPASGTMNLSTHPTLSWSLVSEAAHYVVEVAASSDFSESSLVYRAIETKTRHTMEQSLDYDVRYFWRVKAVNACGAGSSSLVYSFTTEPRPSVICRTPGLVIPDDDVAGVKDALVLPGSEVLAHLSVAITVTHSWVGDLVISLEHVETGNRVVLYDRPDVPESTVGCSGDDLGIIFDDQASVSVEDACQDIDQAYPTGGQFQPNEPLSTFTYGPLGGTWELQVADHAAQDSGVLETWCLLPKTFDTSGTPLVAFDQHAYTSTVAPGAVSVTATLSTLTPYTVTVDYETDGGSAIAGVDYLTTTGTLTFAPGQVRQSFTVSVLSLPSTMRYTTLRLSHPMRAELSTPSEVPLYLQRIYHQIYLPVTLLNSSVSSD